MYGNAFRVLRQQHGFSLRKLAQNTVSIAALSRFECGKGNLSLNNLTSLLHKMGSSLFELAQVSGETDDTNVSRAELAHAYRDSDTGFLAHHCLTTLHVFRESRSMSDFFGAALAAKYYYQLTDKFLIKPDDRSKLLDYFRDISSWNMQDVQRFDDVQALIPVSFAVDCAIELALDQSSFDQRTAADCDAKWQAALNTLYIAIAKQPDEALRLFKSIEPIDISAHCLYIRMRRTFLGMLLAYRDKGDTSSQLEQLISTLSDWGNAPLAAEFQADWDTIRSLRH